MKIKAFFRIFMIAACLWASRAAANEHDLYVYVWAEYIPEAVFSRFTQETGINIHASTFDNLDDMYAKIKITSGTGYDIVMASTEYIALMKRQNLLHKLNKAMLPNLKNIDSMFLDMSFDPQNDYTVPFTVGTSTFAVATDRVDAAKLKKLADLGRPELKGRLILLNDVRAVFGIGLLMNGYTVNETDETRLEQAYKSLHDIVLPNVKAYDTEATIQALINGEADVVMTWNGLLYSAMKEHPTIKEVRFKEGANYWMDNFAVLERSQNVDGAHQFLNFIMRPDIVAEISREYAYTSPNMAAKALLPEDIVKNPVLYPPAKTYKPSLFENDLGDALGVYEKYWLRLKASHYE